MQKLLILLLSLFSFNIYAQTDAEYWAKWDKNYQERDIAKILKYERYYADSVEKHPEIAPSYSRMDKYRFKAIYKGQKRPIQKEVLASMRIVFSFFVGKPDQLNSLVKSEVLFQVGDENIWMPIQANILKALEKEVRSGEEILLYCLFLNEHRSKEHFYNSFLISEFTR